jgi:hypothetical protein
MSTLRNGQLGSVKSYSFWVKGASMHHVCRMRRIHTFKEIFLERDVSRIGSCIRIPIEVSLRVVGFKDVRLQLGQSFPTHDCCLSK